MHAHGETPIGKKVRHDDNSTICRIGENQIDAKHFVIKVRLRRIDAVEDIKTN
jgi:hypothetical protein